MDEQDLVQAPPSVPQQRTSREELLREESERYAASARAGDLGALLAPYHR